MHIGMIGAGMVALAVAREALAKGHQVVLSSRSGPAALAGKVAELGPGTLAATVQEAAALDYVLLAVPWAAVEAALSGLPAWNGRILIDATNPFVETSPQLVLADLGGVGASEIVARLAPGARVVKAFNSIVTARFKTSAGSFQVAACSRPAGRSQDSTCSWRADVPLRLMMSGLETPKQDFAPRCTNCFSLDGRLRRDFAAPLGLG